MRPAVESWHARKENVSVIDSLFCIILIEKNNVYTDYIQNDPLYQEIF